jgi:NAD(P)H-dependent FMN reductase
MALMGRLLIVHHTASPGMQAMLEAVLDGARTDDIEGVDVVTRPALVASAPDLLAADAVLLGTPANIGYMSGALKHFFDTVYYPCLTDTAGLVYGLYVHGNSDTAGAVRAVESIATGLKWVKARPPVTIAGEVTAAARERCWDLGAVTALAAAERHAGSAP